MKLCSLFVLVTATVANAKSYAGYKVSRVSIHVAFFYHSHMFTLHRIERS